MSSFRKRLEVLKAVNASAAAVRAEVEELFVEMSGYGNAVVFVISVGV